MRSWLGLICVVVLGTSCAGTIVPQEHGGTEWVRMRSFDIAINKPKAGVLPILIRTTVVVPERKGRFPLVVLNHGSPRRASLRKRTVRYPTAVQWFTAQGFAVAIPNRRGYGPSGGQYSEGFGPCSQPNYALAGRRTAHDIVAVVRFMRSKNYINGEQIYVVGQSAGGWGALAVASQNVPGVAGVVNFSGGRGSPARGQNCVPEKLVAAAAEYGASADIPSLWLYSKNDGYFGPDLALKMHNAYRKATQSVTEFKLFPAFEYEGHRLFSSPKGPSVWGKVVLEFLGRR